MNRKKTHEEFIKEVYGLVENEYSVLGEYINANTKILMRHNCCGCEWNITYLVRKAHSFRCGMDSTS